MKRSVLWTIGLAVGLLCIWHIVVSLFHIKEFILPGPLAVINDLRIHLRELFFHAWITLGEAILGFVFANVIAICVAITIVYVPGLDKAVLPLAIGLKTTPIVAMAPLLLLWFGNGMAPKVAAAALICFFPSLVNALKGFHALNDGEADLFSVYGASKTQMLFKLRLQRAAPYVLSALKVSSSLCIVGAIIGEFIGANQGIGYVILISSYHLETVHMVAALMITAVTGSFLYGLIAFADWKIVFWLPASSDDIRLESPRRGKKSSQRS